MLMTGNIYYFISLILFDARWQAMLRSLPFMIGCLTTIVADVIVFAQFYYYRTG